MSNPSRYVVIDYTNWRGERRERLIEPLYRIEFENSEWHPETQWVLYAIDREKGRNVIRDFALASIHSWRAANPDDLARFGVEA